MSFTKRILLNEDTEKTSSENISLITFSLHFDETKKDDQR